MKLHLALLTILPSTIYAACYTPPNADPEINYPQKRSASPQSDDSTIDALPSDPLSGPSAITIDLPPQFLPPPWNPFSGLHSPYPSTGVLPWDDSGHSQMIDNEPSIYRTCSRIHLDCRKCPQDWRCRRANAAGGGSSGSTGGTIEPEDDGQDNCPLSKCDQGGSSCGSGAQCTRGFCVCDLGMKENDTAWRGTEGLGQVSVYVDPAVDCDVKCDGLSCKEVDQLDVGACWKSGDQDVVDDGNDNDGLGSTVGSVNGTATLNGVNFTIAG